MADNAPLKVGILVFPDGTQLLDVAPIDVLGTLEPYYLQTMGLPDELVAQAPRIEYHFINETGEGPNLMTGGFRLAITDSISTCPPLDILLIGGPRPTYTPSDAMKSFLQTQHNHVSAFLSVCTGFTAPLHAGLLRNHRATAPRLLLPNLKKEHPDVQWEERRWVRDGKIWTAGAVMNGFEMMREFMIDRWGGEEGGLVNTALALADVPKRGVEY